MQSMLGLMLDGIEQRIWVDPALPVWMPDLTLHGLRLLDREFTIRFWREAEETRYEVLAGDPRHVRRRSFRKAFA